MLTPQPTGEWFSRGWEREEQFPSQAAEAYARALEVGPAHPGARINLGRLLHASRRARSGGARLPQGLEAGVKSALLLFNFGVLLDDMGQ